MKTTLKLIILSTGLYLSACQTTRELPEAYKTYRYVGEAMYFVDRCRKFSSVEWASAVFAYCIGHKIHKLKCGEQEMANTFVDGQFSAYRRAKMRYASTSDAQICALANKKYGKNGSAYPGLIK